MARRDADEAVITFSVNTLKASGGVVALVGDGIYNNVPEGTLPPYVEVKTPTAIRQDTFGRFGQQTLVDVRVVTASPGDLNGFRIRDQCRQALNNVVGTSVGHSILGTAWELNEQLEEMVGGIRTRTHIATFRIWTQQSSS